MCFGIQEQCDAHIMHFSALHYSVFSDLVLYFIMTAIAVIFSNVIFAACSLYHFMNRRVDYKILNKLKHSMRIVEIGKSSYVVAVIYLSV